MEKSESIATENFITAIYRSEQHEGWDTRPGSIARELGITSAAATDMARKLSRKKLIDYHKYKALKLTPSGKKLALSVLRKHRLWESFLHQVLGLSMHEIHREAELLEHATSDFLAGEISRFLGNPSTDPHGDPIPNEKGEVVKDDHSISLALAEAGHTYEVCRISGSDKEFFDFCHTNDLHVGASLKVRRQYSANRMTEVEVNNSRLLLSTLMAGTIYVIRKDSK